MFTQAAAFAALVLTVQDGSTLLEQVRDHLQRQDLVLVEEGLPMERLASLRAPRLLGAPVSPADMGPCLELMLAEGHVALQPVGDPQDGRLGLCTLPSTKRLDPDLAPVAVSPEELAFLRYRWALMVQVEVPVRPQAARTLAKVLSVAVPKGFYRLEHLEEQESLSLTGFAPWVHTMNQLLSAHRLQPHPQAQPGPPSTGQPLTRRLELSHAAAEQTAAMLQALLDADLPPQARIEADPDTNALVVHGSEEVQALVAEAQALVDVALD